MIKIGKLMNESKSNPKLVKTRSAKPSDLKHIKIGDTLYHKSFKGPIIVTEIHKDNSNYTKNFGISGIRVRASDGNDYDLWYDTETLRLQKKIGDGIDRLLIPVMNESVRVSKNSVLTKDEVDRINSKKMKDEYKQKLVDLAESHPKEFKELRDKLKRCRKLENFILKNGIEASREYVAEWSSLLDDIGQLIRKIQGDCIFGYTVDNLLESFLMNESVNYKELVNLASKNEDVSKHKDLGKVCWQYLFPRIKDMARELDIEDTNIIVRAIYDWIKKHEDMN